MNTTAIFFSLCILVAIAITTVGSLEVSEDLVIIGNGTIDRDFAAQSTAKFAGQKLSETILPSAHGNLTFSTYHSNFELIMSNNSSIYYESSSELQDAKHYVSSKNYELGVYTGFYYIGSQNKSFSFESSPSLSEALVKSEAKGQSVIRTRVVNKTYYPYPTVDSLTCLQGNYTIDWAFLVIDYEFPEEGNDDWLTCQPCP